MPPKVSPVHQKRSQVFKALGHPTRLLFVEALAKGEKCVCELQEMASSDMSTVSKHLSLLKKAGIVTDRKEGLWVYYRLRVPCIMKFFDCLEELQSTPAASPKTKRCCR